MTELELRLERWTHALADPTEARRDRVLLDAVIACSQAEAAALWRESRGAWQMFRARGSEGLLPFPQRVRGVLEGGLDGELDSRTQVLRCGPIGEGVALVLVGTHHGDPATGLALLATYHAVARAVDAPWSPALPSGGESNAGSHSGESRAEPETDTQKRGDS